jgi:hypothetical protein
MHTVSGSNRKSINQRALATVVAGQNAVRRFWRDERGLTVSAVILIGILVVAVAAFGAIAAAKIGDAGTEVESVDFGG